VTRRKLFRPGTVYCLRVRHNGRWRIVRGYIGQTRYQDYTKRIDQHLFGYLYNGEWNPPKYWAHEVVDYYPMWQGNWTDWGLNFREALCIRLFFPIHNVLLNVGNPRRVIPPPRDMRVYPTADQITAVERETRRSPRKPPQAPPGTLGAPGSVPVVKSARSPRERGTEQVSRMPHTLMWLAPILLMCGFLAGPTVWGYVMFAWDWFMNNRSVIGLLLISFGVYWFTNGRGPRKIIRKRRR
jgi:hypothetical protein